MKDASALKVKVSKTHQITIIGLLAALAFIIYPLEFPLAFMFPSFLKIDFTDLPALIGTLFFGPMVGVFIEFIKNVLHFLTQSRTGGIGEIANFIVGVAYVVPVGLVYNKVKGNKGYVLGCVAGVSVMAIIACIFNYFILIPFYVRVSGQPVEVYIGAANAIFPFIDSYAKFILFSIGPFNIVKGIMLSFLGYFVCLPLRKHFVK